MFRFLDALVALLTSCRVSNALELSCYCTDTNCDLNHTCTVTSTNNTLSMWCEHEVQVSNSTQVNSIFRCVNETRLIPCIPYGRKNHVELYFDCCMTSMCNKCRVPYRLPSTLYHLLPRPPECPSLPLPSVTSTENGHNATSISYYSNLNMTTMPSDHQLALVIIPLALAVALAIGLWTSVSCFVAVKLRRKSTKPPPILEVEQEATACSSGHAEVQLRERNVLNEVNLKGVIANGKFGMVHLGEWKHGLVAVKRFLTKDTASWDHEKMIYETAMFNHDNLLRCYLCGVWSSPSSHTELWMVLEYHENGSLYQYLSKQTLLPASAHLIITSIVSGLYYLHHPILTDAHSKPGMAHRDLKSKNILVKRDGTCCLADFGLAVRQDLAHPYCVERVPPNPKQGTVRYMAPEVLMGSINMGSFAAHKAADMYSLGLVMWEVLCRTEVKGQGPVPQYCTPYEDNIPHDPTVDEMALLVVQKEIRPPCDPHWCEERVLTVAAEEMQECWRGKPESRPPVALVIKKLKAIASAS